MASSLNSAAQSTAPAPVTPADRNVATGNGTATAKPATPIVAGDLSLLTRPLPADGSSTTTVPVSVAVVSAPVDATAVRPGSDGAFVTAAPGGTAPELPKFTTGDAVPMPRPSGTLPVDVKPLPVGTGDLRPGVVFVGAPGSGSAVFTTTSSGTTLPTRPTTTVALNSGVTVSAGDIARITPAEASGNFTVTQSGVASVLRSFDAARTTELQARSVALEQLRNASPEQRATIIADLQAAQIQVASEQREIARELRTEMRAMREERKGN